MAEEQGAAGKLRACLNCAILKPVSHFKENGCPNCPFLEVNQGKNLYRATSGSFRGVIAVLDPRRSWVAKWQRINSYVPGMYAMTVDGELNDEFIYKVEQNGRVYLNRAQSFELN